MSCHKDLITIFNACFEKTYNTRLVKGDEEPVYLPANEKQPWHAIVFAHGFFSSALHECAHWLIAGERRRLQVDYGYWYVPDGRSAEEQSLFQRVEVKPQALEWILSVACAYRFQFSIDNLNGSENDTADFKQAIFEQVMTYCDQGLSKRASHFRAALCQFYGTSICLDKNQFDKPGF